MRRAPRSPAPPFLCTPPRRPSLESSTFRPFLMTPSSTRCRSSSRRPTASVSGADASAWVAGARCIRQATARFRTALHLIPTCALPLPSCSRRRIHPHRHAGPSRGRRLRQAPRAGHNAPPPTARGSADSGTRPGRRRPPRHGARHAVHRRGCWQRGEGLACGAPTAGLRHSWRPLPSCPSSSVTEVPQLCARRVAQGYSLLVSACRCCCPLPCILLPARVPAALPRPASAAAARAHWHAATAALPPSQSCSVEVQEDDGPEAVVLISPPVEHMVPSQPEADW